MQITTQLVACEACPRREGCNTLKTLLMLLRVTRSNFTRQFETQTQLVRLKLTLELTECSEASLDETAASSEGG